MMRLIPCPDQKESTHERKAVADNRRDSATPLLTLDESMTVFTVVLKVLNP
jgi:hypothetical protein